MVSNPIHWLGRSLRKLGTELMRRSSIEGTWIDVGAHQGHMTLWDARHNPDLKVYAFEPNLRAASKLIGSAPNFLVIPMAVTETDGTADFYLNEFEPASSLLPLNEAGQRSWIGVHNHKVKSVVTVPTIRLDTFMDLTGISEVDFLKVDTQGMDLAVVRSAGRKLRSIAKVMLEVEIATPPLYTGAPSKEEVLNFFEDAGFRLQGVEKQTDGQEENLTFVRISKA